MNRLTRLLVAAALLAAPAAARAGGDMEHEAGGAPDLDALIAVARRMNPEMAIAALEADAAAARVVGADSLPDPKLQWQAMDLPRGSSNYLPARLPRTDKVYLQQDFPLWGKRDLRREVAQAQGTRAAILRQVVENGLVARVKLAYAEYHQAHQAMDIDREILPRLTTIARLAAARYAQGLGRQQEATSAEIERAGMAAELVRFEADRRKARGRLNALLGRGAAEPLPEAPQARPIPAADRLNPAGLTGRAARFNPELRAQDAEITAADTTARLAEKSWYPDIGVTVGAVKANGRFDGYEAMLEVNLPIRGDLREAEIGEAKAMAGAARARRRAKELEIESMMNEAFWNIEAARRTERLILDTSLPQGRIGFESAARSYELGKGDFIMVLTAEQQWRKTHLDRLKAEFDQQAELARIEQLLGGDL